MSEENPQSEPTVRLPDPTSAIVDSGSNDAEPTRLAPGSLGETAPGRSPVEYDEVVDLPPDPRLSPSEYEQIKADFLLDGPAEPLMVLPSGPPAPPTALLVSLGLHLLLTGAMLGVLGSVLYAHLT